MIATKMNYDFNFFQGIYENTLKKGQTFSDEMGENIQKELQKMYKQREEWLKNKQEKQEQDDTGTISESKENQ